MTTSQTILDVNTQGPGLYEITDRIRVWLNSQEVVLGGAHGLLLVFCRHTSASLTIQENADPDVLADLQDFFTRLVSRDPGLYRHGAEGPDDMPAHIRAALLDTSLSIPMKAGRLLLGRWQGIFLFEHRDRPHSREVVLQTMAS